MDIAVFESLLREGESVTLDFKRDQYVFSKASDEERSELVKDILGFANAFKRTDAYILIGVVEVPGDRAQVFGVTEHLKAFTLFAPGLAIAAMGICVADADDALGATAVSVQARLREVSRLTLKGFLSAAGSIATSAFLFAIRSPLVYRATKRISLDVAKPTLSLLSGLEAPGRRRLTPHGLGDYF